MSEEYLKQSGNSQLLKTAETIKFDFEKDVVNQLLETSESETSFKEYIEDLYEKGLIDMDDFTFVAFS